MGQKTISCIGPSIWNNLSDSIKKANSLNTFKRNVKKDYLTWIINNMHLCICVSVCIYDCVSMDVYIHTYGCILVCFHLTYPFSCFCFGFISLTLFSHFRSDLRDHNENKAFLPVLCYPSHCWCYSHFVCSDTFTSTFIL